jgi:hypothetical protein
MGGRGSGPQVMPTVNPEGYPKMGNTEESIGEFQDYVAQELIFDRIDARNADTLLAAARGRLASIRQAKDNAQLDEYKALVQQTTQALREVTARVSDVRTHRVNPAPAVKRATKSTPGTS